MSWNTVIVSDATLEDEVLRADRPVIVDFWAAWCVPCQLVAPILEEQAGRLIVAKLNVDENPCDGRQLPGPAHPTAGCVLRRRTGQIDPRRAAEAGHHGRASGVHPMTAYVDPAGLAEAAPRPAR